MNKNALTPVSKLPEFKAILEQAVQKSLNGTDKERAGTILPLSKLHRVNTAMAQISKKADLSFSQYRRELKERRRRRAEQSEAIPGLAVAAGTAVGALASSKKGQVFTRGPLGAALGYITGSVIKANHTKPLVEDNIARDRKRYERLYKHAASSEWIAKHVERGLVARSSKFPIPVHDQLRNIIDLSKNENDLMGVASGFGNAQHALGSKEHILDQKRPGFQALIMKKFDLLNKKGSGTAQRFPNTHMPQDRDIVTLEKNGAEQGLVLKGIMNGGTPTKTVSTLASTLKATASKPTPIEALGKILKNAYVYRDALAFGWGSSLGEAMGQLEGKDGEMTSYMHSLMNKRAGIVDNELREQQERNDDWRKWKYGLVQTDTQWKKWGSVQKPMLKKAVDTLTLEAENPKFMEREYQQRPQRYRMLREVANNESIMNQNTIG